ncbi:glycogen debranching N-terminal domain-containing protein [Humibacillus xanthopallidus]|uniref:glycogen debranching N-terminal domain-containing protein n=1 Tax=Humibacillus xanthopallidus TaxID=412689 RepID=UPI00384F2D2D
MPDLDTALPPRQPWLHELSIIVDGNATALCDRTGDMLAGTSHGLYVDDRRILSVLRLEVGDEPPASVAARASGAMGEFAGAARGLGDAGADPTVEVLRSCRLDHEQGRALTERVTITSRASERVETTVRFVVGGDGLDIALVKSGRLHGPPTPATVSDGVLTLADEWHVTTVTLDAPDALAHAPAPDGTVVLETSVSVEPGGSAHVTLRAVTERRRASAFDADPGGDAVHWDAVRVSAQDHRLERTLQRGLDDLRRLILRDPLSPQHAFAAAGSPWYLTLFGRDSLWTARLLLPFGTELAEGTLHTLARRQGTATDPRTGEAPGKIPHELRRHVYRDKTSGMTLPQVYYGTVDATALWVCLLAEACDWGLPLDRAADLSPALQAAVEWLIGAGQPDADGLLKYLDTSGTGLANQGWKDSGDSIRWRDGTVAEAPIALVEAQAYAVEALRGAARLYRSLGIDGADRLEAEAAGLESRVRDRFWVDTDAGHHLALAIDGEGRAVDGLGSNMGHVLGTSTLTPDEARSVADTVTSAELLDDFGLRTFGTGNGGFNPIGYHTGSIWTHDTAITAIGLSREGFASEAARVARTLLASAEAFGYRWPELYSGVPIAGAPTPYPASCRPQAWSAASAAALVSVALCPRPEAATRTLHLTPCRPAPYGAMRVEGLRFLGERIDLAVDAEGTVTVLAAPDDVSVVLH